MEDEIGRFLERYGRALSDGDLPGILDCWTVPALVLSDQGATPVAERREVEDFFARSIEWYRSQGLMSTRPMIERVDPLGDRLAALDVYWRAYDRAGKERSLERSYYLVHRGDDARWRIRVALSRPA